MEHLVSLVKFLSKTPTTCGATTQDKAMIMNEMPRAKPCFSWKCSTNNKMTVLVTKPRPDPYRGKEFQI